MVVGSNPTKATIINNLNNMKCTKCWSENIFVKEYRWAYDWWLIRECNDCLTEELRDTGYYILAAEQVEEYWSLLSIAENKEWEIRKFVNFRPYEEPFMKRYDKYDDFFKKLSEKIKD